jgi:ubiquitin C-terminal hydrolase
LREREREREWGRVAIEIRYMDDAMSSPLPPGGEQGDRLYQCEMNYIKNRSESFRGERVYIVSDGWFSQWCTLSGLAKSSIGTLSERMVAVSSSVDIQAPKSGNFVEEDSPVPGPVDNQVLFVPLEAQDPSDGENKEILASKLGRTEATNTDVLREGLIEDKDFFILHEPAWKLLVDWYGVNNTSHVITREYDINPETKECTVNLYEGLESKKDLPRNTMDSEPSPMSIMQGGCLSDTREPSSGGDLTIPKSLGINIPRLPSENVIQYNTPMSPASSFGAVRFATSPVRGSLQMSPLSMGSPLSRSFGPVPIWAEDSVTMGSSDRKGLSGLANLGNTCFMNSSLQCLCHTPSLMYAFLSGQYKDDLNTDNPLGLGGKLASAFGGLLSKVWRPGASFVTPKHFKWQLAKFAPQFGGYSQQDSQELLAFLLDGLHEDLNRIKDKPYKEEKDSDGRPDEEVALEAWENYRARNDSVVVDTFQGLYKSTLKCPKCNHTSVKFDPFMYLSLPLPSPKRRTFQITIVDQFEPRDPLSISIRLSKLAHIGELAREVGKLYCEYYGASQHGVEWIISQWNGKSMDLFLDENATVDSIPEKGSVFSYFSSRSYKLYAYRFAGDCIKPSKAARPVVVHHKTCHGTSGIPSIYFLKDDEISELSVKKSENGNYWEVDPVASLHDALETISSLSHPSSEACDGQINGEDANKEDNSSNMEVDTNQDTKYRVYFASQYGQPKSTSYWASTPPEIGPPDDSNPIYLLAEWENDESKDISVVRGPVVVHESVKILEDQASKPFKATLADCIECFCQPEQLDESDTWYCSKCKDHVRGIKKLDLWYLPPVLVVHLKRFSYSRYSRDKLDTDIEFPLHQLDLSGFISRSAFASSKKLRLSENGSSSDLASAEEDPIYDLYAVSNHFGGMGGGHYTAYCQMPDTKKWYDFDDSTVSEVGPKDVQSSAAYVLFYHRRGSDSGLAQKALEVASTITHGEDAKVCDSPLNHIASPRFTASRTSMDTLPEVPSQENVIDPVIKQPGDML